MKQDYNQADKGGGMVADQVMMEQIVAAADGHIFAKVEVEIVMVNEIGRPIRFPKEIFAKMMPEG